jgi:hypothetical protein
MPSAFVKDPDAALDYKFDWAASTNGNGDADWLSTDETIQTYTITASTGITVDSDSRSDGNTSVTVWLSGGTAGTTYTVACEIVTNTPRTDERTMRILVEDR